MKKLYICVGDVVENAGVGDRRGRCGRSRREVGLIALTIALAGVCFHEVSGEA